LNILEAGVSTELFLKRPFKTRNADEYDLSQVLNLFVQPFEGTSNPFDYENSIIKGRMGSGKTMYLRANYAYYFYGILPSLMNDDQLILPVAIKLSDFQHITEPSEIYKNVIIKVIEGLCSIYVDLQDLDRLAKLHLGIQTLPRNLGYGERLASSIRSLSKLSAEEYIEKASTQLGLKGGFKPKFFELSANLERHYLVELKGKPNPGISDIIKAHKSLLNDYDAKILLLIDEAGSLDKKFFKGNGNDSFFEIIMNQLRTTPFIRTKIAIYPNSYQDILTETRYGDVVNLEEHVYDEEGYLEFRKKSVNLINNYLSAEDGDGEKIDKVFELNESGDFADCLEQLIFASNGNVRRLIQLLEFSMDFAYAEHKGQGKVTIEHAFGALKRNSRNIENLYTPPEKEFLLNIVGACKTRSTYRFKFPGMTPILTKYTSKSQEFNIISIIELGVGRKSTTYAFDYSYCVNHDIPTHYIKNSEKLNKSRTFNNGFWISRAATISEDVLLQASLPGKIEGMIEYIKDDKGFIKGSDEKEYYFTSSFFIEESQHKAKTNGSRVRFFPSRFGESEMAFSIEVL
jgi:hypothetical protein